MTDEEIVNYALAHEYECKCILPEDSPRVVCRGCVINALRAEVKELRRQLDFEYKPDWIKEDERT